MMGAVLVALLAPLAAHAALGGDASSVQTDQIQLQASHRVLNAVSASYTVHEIQLPSGTMVREYLSANGTVFGVAWQGPFMPDLHQLLGDQYFSQYVDAASQRRGLRGPMMVTQPGLVVHSGGHMRAFTGQAYLPALLPPGVTADDIR